MEIITVSATGLTAFGRVMCVKKNERQQDYSESYALSLEKE